METNDATNDLETLDTEPEIPVAARVIDPFEEPMELERSAVLEPPKRH